MTEYFGISWDSDEARLRKYSAALSSPKGRAGDVTVVKIEIEVTESHRLAWILDQLGDIRRKQDQSADRKPRRQGPLLLTHGGGS